MFRLRWSVPSLPLSRTQAQSGQIGIIILLIMVSLLTVGLSLAAQTSQELTLTQQSAESARVFNAAEAGVEEALSQGFDFQSETTTGQLNDPVSGVNVNYEVTKRRTLETRLFEGLTVMVDVTGVATGQNLLIDWARSNDCNGTNPPASLVFSIYYDDAGTTRMRQAAVQGCAHNDNFTAATSTTNVDGFYRHYTLPLLTNDLFVRIKPLYADTDIRVNSSLGWTLPYQFFTVRSEADSTLGDETRVVEVNRTLPAAPAILDYTVYSGTTITK